jgi:integrase
MFRHDILGGLVKVYRRKNTRHWHCSASLNGKRFRATTNELDLPQAQQFAEDWYLSLRGKAKAGLVISEKTFAQAAEQFLKEYEVITEGQRSLKWVEGHGIRLRLHLLPFFGSLGLSQVTPGKVQEYRVHRMTSVAAEKPPIETAAEVTQAVRRRPRGASRSTLHDEIVTLRQVLKTAIRHEWLAYLHDFSPPYRTQGKIVHRPWFSPEEYKKLYLAARAYAHSLKGTRHEWNAEQVYDYILFMANTGLRPDEAKNLQHRDVVIVDDAASRERILEIEVRGKRGIGYCKSMPGAVGPYGRLLKRAKPISMGRHGKSKTWVDKEPPAPKYPEPTDFVFPGDHKKLFNGILERADLKVSRDGQSRVAYSLRHTYICMRLTEGADIYQIAKNCRTSVEMIQKFYAVHIKNTLDAASINVVRSRKRREREEMPTRRKVARDPGQQSARRNRRMSDNARKSESHK